MITISEVKARQVLDSRGNPTVEVDIVLSDGAWGRASVPSGASTGEYEAHELRDADPSRYGGKGVLKAVANVVERIAPQIIGLSDLDQSSLDALLNEIDGTANKSNLGANGMLGVSMAFARAVSQSRGVPLYRYLANGAKLVLPVPMFNIVNGGRHAADSTDFQEFMVVPAGFERFSDALRAGVEIYHALGSLLKERGLNTNVGDEGGYAPTLSSDEYAVELVVSAIDKAGYRPGEQCFIALDVAASEFYEQQQNEYFLARQGQRMGPQQLTELYERWVRQYPIISIEDGMAEDDWPAWQQMTDRLRGKVQLVGDDLLVTNTERIQKAIELRAANAVLIKLNQIGTVSETLKAISMTKEADWGVVISHRSGETEDTTIADLAVGTAAGQIKSGAPARGERTAKYNRLLRIEEELGDEAGFAGPRVYEYVLRNRR